MKLLKNSGHALKHVSLVKNPEIKNIITAFHVKMDIDLNLKVIQKIIA